MLQPHAVQNILVHRGKFPWGKNFVVLPKSRCEPYKFPRFCVLFFQTMKTTKILPHGNYPLCGFHWHKLFHYLEVTRHLGFILNSAGPLTDQRRLQGLAGSQTTAEGEDFDPRPRNSCRDGAPALPHTTLPGLGPRAGPKVEII